jgi:uncharacterized protein (TIGR02466 family)
MHYVVDSTPGEDVQVLRPFGPPIVKKTMSDQVQALMIDVFERHNQALDNSYFLAGDLKREFTIDANVLTEEQATPLVQLLASGSSELYKAAKDIEWASVRDAITEPHREIVETRLQDMQLSCAVHSCWGNISVAGDWNPMHKHTGMVSGVGYLKLPDDIEDEWADGDHDPSACMLQFLCGTPAEFNVQGMRVKPRVGDIYFFPAWLQHEVYPFRSKGERWSFSFNTSITNLVPDIGLSAEDKLTLSQARDEKRRRS